MYKYILAEGGDINWMALFALVTFVTMFLIGAFTALRRRKSYFRHMAHLPLDTETTNQ